MLLEDTPSQNEGLTTIHFPDIHINYFRLLLDFLYSGQTYVPVYELEQLQDLLELLQIKPNKWRSGDSRKDIDNGKIYLFKLLIKSIANSTFEFADSQKLDSSNEGGLNLISKNNNNHSNNNRNRTSSSTHTVESPKVSVKSERIARSSSHETETAASPTEKDGSAPEAEIDDLDANEDDENNNEDEEREEGEVYDEEESPETLEKSKLFKKKKKRRRKRELTLRSDQNQQIEDDDEMEEVGGQYHMKHEPSVEIATDDIEEGNLSDNYSNNNSIHKNSVTIRRRHSSSSDPVNLSIANKQDHQEDSDDANIDVETISNAPTKVNEILYKEWYKFLMVFSSIVFIASPLPGSI